jgi:hypothetical protein
VKQALKRKDLTIFLQSFYMKLNNRYEKRDTLWNIEIIQGEKKNEKFPDKKNNFTDDFNTASMYPVCSIS